MGHVVAFTGGGTGGHVFPGLAVIEALRDVGISDVCWIGSRHGVEAEIVSSWGLPFYAVPAGKLRRYFSLRTVLDTFRVIAGFVAALFLLRKLSPRLVFSKGGYVTVPVVAAARLLRIPCYTHESDLDPGLATKLNSRLVQKVLVAYEQSCNYFPDRYAAKLVVTGNPVRRAVLSGSASEGRRLIGAESERVPVVLFLGGSLGAAQINALVRDARQRLVTRWWVVHQAGAGGACEAGPGYYGAPFFTAEYPHILAAADLVVCRAGAGTIWELAVTGTPALLIPLGLAGSRGDQIRNAELYSGTGAAEVLSSGETTAEQLVARLAAVFDDPERLATMASAARSFAGPDAAVGIARMIQDEIA